MDQQEADLWALSEYSKIQQKDLQKLSWLRFFNRITKGRWFVDEIVRTEAHLASCERYRNQIFDRYN